MARVRVEDVLRDLDRPLEPRPEFTDALLAMLELELAEIQPEVEKGPEPKPRPRARPFILRRPVLAGGLALVLAIAAVVVGTLPGGRPSALAVVEEARAKFADIPSFRATVIQRTPGEAIAEEKRLEKVPDLIVEREVAYQGDAYFRVDVVGTSWDDKAGPWNDHRESRGSFTVADGTYIADYRAFEQELAVGRIADEDVSAIRFKATALLDPDLHEFGDYSDAYFAEHCEVLSDTTIVGRRARHIHCADGIESDIWLDAESGFVLRYEVDGTEAEGLLGGRGTWLEVTEISYGGSFDPSEFEIVVPDGARVVFVGEPPIPERFKLEADPRVGATIDVRGHGGPIVFAGGALWASGTEGGTGPSLEGGIGYIARIDPATNEIISTSSLVPAMDKMPKGYTGPLVAVDEAVASGSFLWVAEYHAGKEWTRHFRFWKLDLASGGFVGDPSRLPGQPAGLAATEDAVFTALGYIGTTVVGPAHLPYGGLARIDSTTGEQKVVEFDGNADTGHAAAADKDHLYLGWHLPDLEDVYAPGRNVILKVDQATMDIVDTFELPAVPFTHGGLQLALDEGRLWVAYGGTDGGILLKMDAATGEIIDRATVGKTASDIEIGGGLVWISAFESDAVFAVDPKTMEVVEKVTTGSMPRSLAFGNNALWVQHSSDGSVVRIDL